MSPGFDAGPQALPGAPDQQYGQRLGDRSVPRPGVDRCWDEHRGQNGRLGAHQEEDRTSAGQQKRAHCECEQPRDYGGGGPHEPRSHYEHRVRPRHKPQRPGRPASQHQQRGCRRGTQRNRGPRHEMLVGQAEQHCGSRHQQGQDHPRGLPQPTAGEHPHHRGLPARGPAQENRGPSRGLSRHNGRSIHHPRMP